MKKISIGALVTGVIIAVMGFCIRIKEQASIAIIGGADGPTSVFIAGKVPNRIGSIALIVRTLLLIVCILIIRRKK